MNQNELETQLPGKTEILSEKSGEQGFVVGHLANLLEQKGSPAEALSFAEQNIGGLNDNEKLTVKFMIKLAGLGENPLAESLLQKLEPPNEAKSVEVAEISAEDNNESGAQVIDMAQERQKRIDAALDKMGEVIATWDSASDEDKDLFVTQTGIGLPKWDKLSKQSQGVSDTADVTELASKIKTIKELIADYKITQIKKARGMIDAVKEEPEDETRET